MGLFEDFKTKFDDIKQRFKPVEIKVDPALKQRMLEGGFSDEQINAKFGVPTLSSPNLNSPTALTTPQILPQKQKTEEMRFPTTKEALEPSTKIAEGEAEKGYYGFGTKQYAQRGYESVGESLAKMDINPVDVMLPTGGLAIGALGAIGKVSKAEKAITNIKNVSSKYQGEAISLITDLKNGAITDKQFASNVDKLLAKSDVAIQSSKSKNIVLYRSPSRMGDKGAKELWFDLNQGGFADEIASDLGTEVKKYNVEMKNPLEVNGTDEAIEKLWTKEEIPKIVKEDLKIMKQEGGLSNLGDTETTNLDNLIAQQARKKGYDGIIFKERGNVGEALLLNPKNAKKISNKQFEKELKLKELKLRKLNPELENLKDEVEDLADKLLDEGKFGFRQYEYDLEGFENWNLEETKEVLKKLKKLELQQG